MTEHWEVIIESEINFYLHFAKYKEELQERLFENEQDIQFHTTVFDSEVGCIYRRCLGTEDMAFKRILVRDALHHLLEKADKRMMQLFSPLNARNKVVLRCCYLEPDKTDGEWMRQLGLQNEVQLQKEKEHALKALYRLNVEDRKKSEDEFKVVILEECRQRAAVWKRQLRTS